MSYETPRRLISLACPIIINPCQEIANDQNGLFLPPFPLVNLNWDGFTISHLHWIGIHHANRDHMRYILSHESCHAALAAATPFLQYKKQLMLILQASILDTFQKRFKKEQKLIEVPIIAKKSGNSFQKRLDEIVHLQRESMLVEEIFSVRSSLTETLNKRLILYSEYNDLSEAYKIKYGYIPKFSNAYDAFDFVAGKIGETTAEGLVYGALTTFKPASAFLAILSRLCKINSRVPTNDSRKYLWKLSDKETDRISSFSFEEAYDYFKYQIELLDPDDSLYRVKEMVGFHIELGKLCDSTCQELENDFDKFVYGEPTTFLFCEYSSFIHPFEKGDGCQEVPYGDFIIVLEAILQQLIQGIGLLCPFWGYSPGTCCNSDNKAFLENVWSSTSPSRSCKRWERLGCLEE